jgi:hypothetical protein
MRYMMFVMGNSDYQAGKPPSPQLMAEIGKLAEEATRSGKMLMSEGLRPTATRIFEVASHEEALQHAQRFVDAHERCGVNDFMMEIRPMFGPEDFGSPR